jgi:hypothetical protein
MIVSYFVQNLAALTYTIAQISWTAVTAKTNTTNGQELGMRVIVFKESGKSFCKGTPAFVEEIVRELIQDKAVGSRSTRITGILRDFE